MQMKSASPASLEKDAKMNTKKTKKTDIVNKLTALSDKITNTETAFYRAAEDYLRSAIEKQKEEKIDLSDANIALFANEDSEDYLEDLEYLYYDGDVTLAIGGYDYLLSDLDMSSVIRLVEWVKDNA